MAGLGETLGSPWASFAICPSLRFVNTVWWPNSEKLLRKGSFREFFRFDCATPKLLVIAYFNIKNDFL
jgi:hypothetical protein